MRILHWFRKDLRLDDNTALSEAAHDGDVVPFYTSEPAILGRDDMAPTRVRFALESLAALRDAIASHGGTLALAHGDAAGTVLAAARAAQADAVYWNDEYEPSLRERDARVEAALRAAGVRVKRFHDRLIVAPGGVTTQQGGPFSVYTPFRKACEAKPVSAPHPPVTTFATHALPAPTLAPIERLGFAPPTAARWPGGEREARRRFDEFLDAADSALARYGEQRDVPAVRATSLLSADLKFGTIGIRRVLAEVRAAAGAQPSLRASADKYVSELRWRDFFAHVLWHWPHVERGAFRPMYDALRWQGSDALFDAWCAGRTGYPIVDAGMRELLATGLMHNRVRMIVASFLTKDLLLDWRRGERHFMRHLVDGDLASNNGGWQWAAGTGTDAAPYFRIFNPESQGRRFDPDGAYVKRWVPELAGLPAAHVHAPHDAPPLLLAAAGVTLGEDYPFPIVDHAKQREACLAMYREVRPDVG
ncbi:MAG: deoxyribodipyrimidine photo-lyase [Candidatus Eisenbacteria bacterium]